MTEKRFTELISSTIWDNKEDKGLTVEDAVDLLNELHEGNYKLKKEIEYLQSELHNCYMDVRERTLKEVKDSIKKLERFE